MNATTKFLPLAFGLAAFHFSLIWLVIAANLMAYGLSGGLKAGHSHSMDISGFILCRLMYPLWVFFSSLLAIPFQSLAFGFLVGAIIHVVRRRRRIPPQP